MLEEKNFNLAPLQDLDDGTKSKIDSFTKLVKFPKNQIILNSGELLNYFYIISKGRVKTYQINFSTNKEQTLSILREGDMFDTLVLLDSKPHDVIYQTLEDVELIQMPIRSVRELLKTNSDFNQKFFPYIAKQIRNLEELAVDLSLYSTYERLIKLLIQNINTHDNSKLNLINNLSHTEIAKLIGTVRQVVERHLKELQKDGAIDLKSKDLQIIDTKKLLKKIELL